MKTLGAMVIAAMLAGSISNALAVDIVNEDSVPYTLHLFHKGEETVIEIGANETISGACDFCVVVLPGGDGVEVGGDESIIITNGKLAIGS